MTDVQRARRRDERIRAIQVELADLLKERAGTMCIIATPEGFEKSEVFGWCVVCGNNTVSVDAGFDTCRECA